MSSNGTVAHAIEQSGGELNATCHDKYVVVYDYSKTGSSINQGKFVKLSLIHC